MIPIKEEPKDMYENTGVYEQCTFCNRQTKMWHEESNNPVCETCADKYTVEELLKISNPRKISLF